MQVATRQCGQKMLRRLVDSVAEVLYSITLAGSLRIKFINANVKTLTGYTAEELLSDEWEWVDIVHSDDRLRFVEAFEGCRRFGADIELEYRIVHKNGSVREVLDRARL